MSVHVTTQLEKLLIKDVQTLRNRVNELLEANNAEVGRRRAAEAELARVTNRLALVEFANNYGMQALRECEARHPSLMARLGKKIYFPYEWAVEVIDKLANDTQPSTVCEVCQKEHKMGEVNCQTHLLRS